MNLADAILLSSVVITLGGLAIAVSVITKKKGLSISLFVAFVVIIAFVFVFKDLISDSMKYLTKSKSEKNTKLLGNNYLRLKLENIDSEKPTIKDIIYNFSKPYFINDDSTVVIYSPYSEFWLINKRNGERVKLEGNEAIEFLMGLKNDYILGNESHYSDNIMIIFELNDKIVQNCFISNYESEYLDIDVTDWSYKSILDNFGKPEKVFISNDYSIKILKFDNNYLYFKNNSYIFTELDFTGTYNINKRSIFAKLNNMTFTEEKNN